MSRLLPPLILLAALAAGRAHAQAGDRYGPRPVTYVPAADVGYAAAAGPALRGAPAAPRLRSLTWAGKTELRPALDAGYAELRPAAGPAYDAPPPAAVTSTGRFPGVRAYAAPAPALRTGAASATNPAAPSSAWPATPRPAATRRPAPAYAAEASAPAYARAPAPAPSRAPPASWPMAAPSPSPDLAAPPAYVAPGPAYGAALAAQARREAQAAAAPTLDTLPPPTVGRYGYVGPGRSPPATVVAAPVATVAPPAAAGPADPTALGPPRPPAYARAYVLPAAAAVPAGQPNARAPSPALGEGGRRYSVHREYGMEPDPVPVPPQFFGATADLSVPDAAPTPVRSKAAVNAARLAASGD